MRHREYGGMARQQPPKEFEEKVISIDRVSRTVAGGRRMRFRALVLVGNHAGKVGMGIAKGQEVQAAIAKATTQASKHVIEVPIVRETIPYNISARYGSTIIHLKSAKPGTSIIAGGLIRQIMQLAGVSNVVGKIIGSTNKINNAKATFLALTKLRDLKHEAAATQTRQEA